MSSNIVNNSAPPRTFGELRNHPNYFYDFDLDFGLTYHTCAYCGVGSNVAPGDGLWKYSTRHYACTPCVEARADKVLPKVARHERFKARIQAAGLLRDRGAAARRGDK